MKTGCFLSATIILSILSSLFAAMPSAEPAPIAGLGYQTVRTIGDGVDFVDLAGRRKFRGISCQNPLRQSPCAVRGPFVRVLSARIETAFYAFWICRH